MKIEITREDALHRDFIVELSDKDFNAKVDARLSKLVLQVKVPGFRPGKVPLSIMRQRFSERIHGEVVEKLIDETTRNLIGEYKLTPAMQPKLEITEFDPNKGLTYTAAFVLSGDITLVDLKKVSPTKHLIVPEDIELQDALEGIQKDMRTSVPIKRKRKSKMGDLVVIDFVGSIDGEEFDGGTAKDYKLELGSEQFIPGFENQVVGMSKGDQSDVTVTLPKDYGQAHLADKDAVFAVTLKDIHDFELPEFNDEMAKQLGLDDLEALKTSVRERIRQEYVRLSDEQLRRELFDILDAKHEIALADEMIDAEYSQLETQYKQERKNVSLSPEEMEQPEERGLANLREIAVRRVRLALILAEFGKKFSIEVDKDDLHRQLMEEARNYPGQEQQFVQSIQQNQQAMQQLRARTHESAVVRVLLEMIKPVEQEVTLKAFHEIQEAQDKAESTSKKAPAKKSAKSTAE
ncbi:MAG: trigger factor [Alphaproteobacteria bacterium]|nr:trigger factor [Alphaproteobacteria bacterium]